MTHGSDIITRNTKITERSEIYEQTFMVDKDKKDDTMKKFITFVKDLDVDPKEHVLEQTRISQAQAQQQIKSSSQNRIFIKKKLQGLFKRNLDRDFNLSNLSNKQLNMEKLHAKTLNEQINDIKSNDPQMVILRKNMDPVTVKDSI